MTRTKVSIMKNHVNGLGFSDGKIMVTAHGFMKLREKEDEKKAKEQKKTRQKLNLSKADVQNTTEQAISNSRQQQSEPIETIVREQPKIGRNERVTIKNVMSGEEKVVKFKQAIPLIERGEWVLVKS